MAQADSSYALGRPFPQRVGIAAAVVAAALIVGLLGMHASGSTAQHGPASAARPALHDTGSEAPTLRSADHEPLCDCAAPSPSPEHSMLLMCALAVLVALLVLDRPGSLLRLITRTRSPSVMERAAGSLSRHRPPSLIALSISRT